MIELRAIGDPLADDALAALKKAPRPGENVLARVEEGARAGNAALARFLDETRSAPAWFDARALADGRRAMTRYAPATFLALLCGSLVESFAIAEGAAVLVKTGRLLRDTAPRIYETASLVRDALLHDDERFRVSCLRVRLLHAAVRRYARKLPGVAVNQMDQTHTLLMFSRVCIRGVEALGGRISRDEKASWCALWRYAGHFLGVQRVPRDLDEEAELYREIRGHYRVDDGSRALAHAVLGTIADQPPFHLPKRALHAISRRCIGDALGDAFALERSRRWSALARVMSVVPVGERLGWAFIESNRRRVLRTMPEADYSFRTA